MNSSVHTLLVSPRGKRVFWTFGTHFFSYFQCEKLRKKRSSLVGAFVSTHGKSIDDVDRSIVEAR